MPVLHFEESIGSIQCDLPALGVVSRSSSGFIRHLGHDGCYGMAISGFEWRMWFCLSSKGLKPIKEMVGPLDVLDFVLPSDGPVTINTAFCCVNSGPTAVQFQGAFFAEKAGSIATAVTEVGGIGHHGSLGITPHCIYLIRSGEVILVLPGVGTAMAVAGFRNVQTS